MEFLDETTLNHVKVTQINPNYFLDFAGFNPTQFQSHLSTGDSQLEPKALETPSCRVICCWTSSTDSAEPSSCPDSAERATTRRATGAAAAAVGAMAGSQQKTGEFHRWKMGLSGISQLKDGDFLEMLNLNLWELQVGGVNWNFLGGISIVSRVRFSIADLLLSSTVLRGLAQSCPLSLHLLKLSYHCMISKVFCLAMFIDCKHGVVRTWFLHAAWAFFLSQSCTDLGLWDEMVVSRSWPRRLPQRW